MAEDETFVLDSVAATAPNVASTTITQVHVLTASSVATASPVVDSIAMSEAETLVPVSVVSGTPALPDNIFPALPEGQLPIVTVESGNPIIGTPAATINIVLTASDIVSGTPTIPTLVYDIGLAGRVNAATAVPNSVEADDSINSVVFDNDGINSVG